MKQISQEQRRKRIQFAVGMVAIDSGKLTAIHKTYWTNMKTVKYKQVI
ncbi:MULTISPECIES: hypothetical protein [Lysinibacillus]|nr:hypothetical protein [Lysinibacillus sphaericus]MEB7454367.1 hypothetical protein [Lysinibacillus sphaericus]WKT76888.1 hypothetical protein QYY55_23100 [Lysinibacillus fusiformis]